MVEVNGIFGSHDVSVIRLLRLSWACTVDNRSPGTAPEAVPADGKVRKVSVGCGTERHIHCNAPILLWGSGVGSPTASPACVGGIAEVTLEGAHLVDSGHLT